MSRASRVRTQKDLGGWATACLKRSNYQTMLPRINMIRGLELNPWRRDLPVRLVFHWNPTFTQTQQSSSIIVWHQSRTIIILLTSFAGPAHHSNKCLVISLLQTSCKSSDELVRLMHRSTARTGLAAIGSGSLNSAPNTIRLDQQVLMTQASIHQCCAGCFPSWTRWLRMLQKQLAIQDEVWY